MIFLSPYIVLEILDVTPSSHVSLIVDDRSQSLNHCGMGGGGVANVGAGSQEQTVRQSRLGELSWVVGPMVLWFRARFLFVELRIWSRAVPTHPMLFQEFFFSQVLNCTDSNQLTQRPSHQRFFFFLGPKALTFAATDLTATDPR